MVTSCGAVDREDHSLSAVTLLSAVKPERVLALYSVVPSRELICLIGGDRMETGVEDGFLGRRIEKRVADVAKGRLGNRVIFLFERKHHSITIVGKQSRWSERDRVWSGAADSDLVHRGSGDRDEGKSSERSGKHYVRDVRGL